MMKNSISVVAALLTFMITACTKSSDTGSQITLTASTTQAAVGQQVAVTVSSNANVTKWTVSPSSASKTFTLSTSKVNNFTFAQPGTYTVSVSAKSLAYDSTSTQSLENVWNNAKTKSCVQGVDSTSVKISVVK